MLKEERAFIKPLTGIRAVAAFLVFIYHYNIFHPQVDKLTISSIVNELHIGVNLFFVLSGFLITYRYYHRRKELLTRAFYVKRFARIYPLLLILTSLSYLYIATNSQPTDEFFWTNYLLNISLLSGFFNELKFTGIPQAWSITVEELFYITTPLIFMLVRSRKLHIISISLLLLVLGSIIVLISNWLNFPHGFFETLEFMLTYTFFGRSIEFLIGLALAIYYLKNSDKLHHLKLKYKTYGGILFSALCLLLASMLTIWLGEAAFYPKYIVSTILLPLLGIAPFYLGLITEKTIISKLLSSNLFQLLGKSSYAFYLIHLGFIAQLIDQQLDSFIGLFILLHITAILLYFGVEKPLNKLITAKFIKRTI